jgi:hypothetical protein
MADGKTVQRGGASRILTIEHAAVGGGAMIGGKAVLGFGGEAAVLGQSWVVGEEARMASWQGRRAIAGPPRSMDAAIVGAPSGGDLVDAGVRVSHLPSHLPLPRLRSWSPPRDSARPVGCSRPSSPTKSGG